MCNVYEIKMYKKHPIVYNATGHLHSQVPDTCIGIGGKVYDVSAFSHPGGKVLIEFSKGQDCTALFQSHHVNFGKAEKVLSTLPCVGDYEVVDDYDFSMYRKVTNKVLHSLKNKNVSPRVVFERGMVVFMTLSLHVCLCFFPFFDPWLVILTSVLNTLSGGIGHNYLHRVRPLSLMLDWNGLSTSEWILEHTFSHHMHTNKKTDHDAVSMEPFVSWLPGERGFLGVAGMHALFCVAEVAVAWNGLFVHRVRWLDSRFPFWLRLAPLVFPLRILSMLAFRGLQDGVFICTTQCLIASYLFSFLAHLNHSEVIPESKDFLIHQLSQTRDLKFDLHLGLNKQTMHHLYPSVDHSLLTESLRERLNSILLSISKQQKPGCCQREIINLYSCLKSRIKE